MTPNERNELVDMVAQAVIDKMQERERTNQLAELVVQRVIALQKEEAALNAADQAQENTHGTN
jgi:hypothetical protein